MATSCSTSSVTWAQVLAAVSDAIATSPHNVPVTSVTLRAVADGLLVDEDEASKIPPYTCSLMYLMPRGGDVVMRLSGTGVPPKVTLDLRGLPAKDQDTDRFRAYIKGVLAKLNALAPALLKDQIVSYKIGAHATAATLLPTDPARGGGGGNAAALVKGLHLDNAEAVASAPLAAGEGGGGTSPSGGGGAEGRDGAVKEVAQVRCAGSVAAYQSMLTCVSLVAEAQVEAAYTRAAKLHRPESQRPEPPMPDEEKWQTYLRETPAALALPSTTGLFGPRYLKGRKLGEGTFGEVCAAFDRATERWVVLKVLRRAEHTQGGLHNTITREIVAMKALVHKNLLPLLDVLFQPHGSVVLVFDLVPHDLQGLCRYSPILGDPAHLGSRAKADYLRRGAIKCVVRQLLAGLNFLHQQGAWHRDVKQSNVLVHHDGTVVLCDFGWTRIVSRLAKDNADFGNLTWPPCALNYRPLEIWCGRRAYDGAAIDMYGLGCMVFEMFARRPLFEGTTEVDIVRNIIDVAGAPEESSQFPHSELVRELLRKKQTPPRQVSVRCLDFYMTPEAAAFVSSLTQSDPKRRLSAVEASKHDWFTEEPLPLTVEAFADLLPSNNCHAWVLSQARR